MSDTDKHDGGPAFPTNLWDGVNGMSLLDYFAGEAMQGLSANADYSEILPSKIAVLAYEQAKAMLEERNRISGAEAGEAEPEKTE